MSKEEQKIEEEMVDAEATTQKENTEEAKAEGTEVAEEESPKVDTIEDKLALAEARIAELEKEFNGSLFENRNNRLFLTGKGTLLEDLL